MLGSGSQFIGPLIARVCRVHGLTWKPLGHMSRREPGFHGLWVPVAVSCLRTRAQCRGPTVSGCSQRDFLLEQEALDASPGSSQTASPPPPPHRPSKRHSLTTSISSGLYLLHEIPGRRQARRLLPAPAVPSDTPPSAGAVLAPAHRAWEEEEHQGCVPKVTAE